MPYQLYSQDNFTKAELTPFLYARAQVNQYYDGMKIAQNVMMYPTGAAGKRFGTLYQATLANITEFDQLFFQTFQYLDQCVYQLAFTPTNIAIYLEGILQANVTTTLNDAQVYNLKNTTLGAAFRVTGQGFKPYDLTRAANSGNVITAASANVITLTTPVSGTIFPVTFTTTGAMPTSDPAIQPGIIYFIKLLSASTAKVYATAFNAKFGIDEFTITDNGSGTNTLFIQNTWSFSHSVFKNLPIYDFNGVTTSYDAITFTPSATTGTGVTITLSSAYAPLTSVYVGGAFIGAGGSGRITAVTDTTHFTVSVQTPFDSTNPIQGSLTFLAEPAWSDTRGWPQVCSSYQNRALFANTVSLPNGFWASVVNDYTDFGDLTTDDDDAISWFPSSNDVNVIRFIVPFRSITVHTNSGIYSSPLSEIAAITPTTFTLQLQDSTPADVLQPVAIDNQIFVLSGNDMSSLVWDGINNAYTTNIISAVNEQTIRSPLDEIAYADLHHAGSRYVFIINEIGSMAMYQTLQSEAVSGMTPQLMEQSYGEALIRQGGSSSDGRAWFVVERDQLGAGSPVSITAFAAHTLTAVATNFDTTFPTPITFQTTGTLPASTPPLAVLTYYWAIGVTADTFQVYATQEDALALVNAFTFTSAGTNSHVVPWTTSPIFTLEELSQDVRLDCAILYDGAPTSTVTTGTIFNGQEVKMIGDGFAFDAIGEGNNVVFEAHGQPVQVSKAYIGFPINLVIEPMALTMPAGNQTTLTKPKHVRSVRFWFNNTIGGTINGIPIALDTFDQADPGEPPFPSNGIFEMSIMKGWDDFKNPTFTIEHNDPYDIQLIGVFYSVDT